MSDSAHWKPGRGWGGESHLYEDWGSDDWGAGLENDEILKQQLAEDAKLDGKRKN